MAIIKVNVGSYNPANTRGVLGASPPLYYATLGGSPSAKLNDFYSQVSIGTVISGLFLYKGLAATQDDIDGIPYTATGAIANVYRYADLLCWFPIPSIPAVDTVARTMTFSFSPSKALFSGTATWFIFGKYYTNTTYFAHCLMSGSVGAIGSGSDLELETLNLIAGSIYKAMPIVLPLPNTITY